MDWGAVVLTGGTADRLGGADKAGLAVGGRSLLERVLAATAGAGETVLVGDEVATSRPVRFAREDPPGGGPGAALLAGADALAAFDVVVVVAVDMPLVTAATVDRLLAALRPDTDGAVLDDGRRQPLCAAYRRDALLSAAPARRTGLPVRRLVEGLRLVGVPAMPGEGRDVDEWSDLQEISDDLLRDPAPGGESSGP
jgi:molybdopterin-guanine dinucleotide biosynthesis protein A